MGFFSDDDLAGEPSTQLMGNSGHMDSPLERKAAAERARMGQRQATGSLFKASKWDNYVAGDADGDGKVSAQEASTFATMRAAQAKRRAAEEEANKQAAFRLAGVSGAGGYFGGRGAFLTQARDRDANVAGDADGDGQVSLAERYDKDGDVSPQSHGATHMHHPTLCMRTCHVSPRSPHRTSL